MVNDILKHASFKRPDFDELSLDDDSGDASPKDARAGWLSRLVACGHRPSDTAEQRRQKSLFTLVTILKATVCAGWYVPLWIFGAWVAGAAPFVYQILTTLSLGFFARSKDLRSFHQRQILLILLLPMGLHVGLGSFAESGGVLMWSFLAPLGSLLFQGPRESLRWLWAFFALVALAMMNELFSILPIFSIPAWMQTLFFAMNFCCVMGITYAGVRYFAYLLKEEKAVQMRLNRSLNTEKQEQERLNARLEREKSAQDRLVSALASEKAAQEALNDALKAANEHKSRFLAGMSHELRTPLNAIMGFTRIVKRKARKTLPTRQLENLDKVLVSSEHLLTLINDILDLSKIEAGQIKTVEQTFVVQNLVRETLQTAQTLMRDDVALIDALDDVIPPMRSDPNRIKQILLNLLSNAAKFTHKGHVKMALLRRGTQHIEFRVEDTGIGISEEACSRVFEEFQQADNSTTREYGGTGLGLPISRRLAHLLGGELTFTSTPGEGSTFILVLPLRPGDEPVTGDVTPLPSDALRALDEQPLVLTVDDDPDARYLLRESLEGCGFDVVEASDGDEGLEKARQLKPAVITLDIMMPGKDGWQTLHDLKNNNATREIPVIISSIVDDRQLALDLGASDFLSKPVSQDSLQASIKRLIKQRPQVTS